MDAVSHGLTGYLVKKVFFIRNNSKFFLFLFMIAFFIPDIDYLWGFYNVGFHRHFTHSLILSPIFAFLYALLFYFLIKKSEDYIKLFTISMIGILTHIGLDSLLVWGVQLFWPITSKYYSLNLYLFCVEPYTYVVLLIVLILFFLKINKKFIQRIYLYLGIMMLSIFFFRYALFIRVKSMIKEEDVIVLPYIESYDDFFFQKKWKIITIDNDKFKTIYMDVFEGKAFRKTDSKYIYTGEKVCSTMHDGYMFKDGSEVADIRYRDTMGSEINYNFKNDDCFWAKILDKEILTGNSTK